MRYVIIETITPSRNRLYWTDSEFLFREYLKGVMKHERHIQIEYCETDKKFHWIIKKYSVDDTQVINDRIVLIHDRKQTVFAVTTYKDQMKYLGGRSLFESLEDKLRMSWVNKGFWLITYLTRYSHVDQDIVDNIYRIIGNKYLDCHSIDMNLYLIEGDSFPSVYKI